MPDAAKKPKLTYCCPVKEYYSNENNLVASLEIAPRIIVCKKPLRVNHAYEQNIVVKNNGSYPRFLKCYTDSGDDTHLKLHGIQRLEYVSPGTTLNIHVRIMPTSKKLLDRSRNVFIESEHPNIVFEIPIIVVKSFKDPYLPSSITFPSTVPKNSTYYEFLIYNPTTDIATVLLRPLNGCLSAQADAPRVNPKDFIRVLLKLIVKDAEIVTDIMKIRFSNVQLPIGYFHKPVFISLYPNTTFICFEETKFGRENRKEFLVCNEAFISAPFKFSFGQRERRLDSTTLHNTLGSGDSLIATNFSSSSVKEMLSAGSEGDGNLTDTSVFKNYTIEPMSGEFEPNSCNTITIIFRPLIDEMEMDDNLVPPFSAGLQVALTSPEYECEERHLWVSGLIDGPETHYSPKAIDFRQIYLGEEHCERINITNTDGVVTSKISFFDCTGDDSSKYTISPKEGLILEPCEMGSFNFNFFTTIIGKIFFKIRFKVRNGNFLSVIVKANSVSVRVKTFPDLVEFGSIPFAVPQKRTVLLMNPLSVPLTLQCFIPDNGSEMPLVLNVENVDELPPVDTRNPIESILAAKYELMESGYDLSELEDVFNPYSEVSSLNSIHVDDSKTMCSEKFQNEVIENIESLANKVINNIKLKRIPEKNEPEVKIIYEVTQELLELPYFSELTKYNNYACMNWETIPSDPTELYHDTEIIHLKPNAGRSITVLVIPNIVGYFNRAIHIRCCPHSQISEWEKGSPNSNHVMVESDVMITKLWVEYNCCIPDLKYTSNVVLKQREIYAMQIYDFNMKFINDSNIGGFVQYLIVPYCREGVMGFRNHKWKFFVNAEDVVVAQCYVEFRRTGNITLTGMIKIVGNSSGLPFHISAHVLPTKVQIVPRYLYKRQYVLELSRATIYIYNKTPTVTAVNFYLRSERYQKLEPHGAQIGPNQATYVTIFTTFRDPEVYKNILYVDLLHGVVLEVPLTFNIIGIPVFFDPEVRSGIDAGVILLSSEEDYELRITNYTKRIRVWNLGERPYGISFRRLKAKTSSRRTCKAEALRAQFYVEPKLLLLPPGGESYITISAVACEEAIVYNEFAVVVTDQTDSMRFSSIRFTLTAKFCEVEIGWSRREIVMTYNRTHKFKQHQQIEIVKLINLTGIDIDSLRVKVCGPFRIKELFEHPFAREIELSLKSDERKELTITYNKREFGNKLVPELRGKIFTFANNKPQKSLPLKVIINYPDVIIVHSNIVIFTTSMESTTDVLIENVGNLIAQYKWKKLDQFIEYIADYDDAWAFSRELLSDIIQMLDLHEEEGASEDSICQRNMTLCYQKYRCKVRKLEDSGGVFEIINEIIDSLDLEHKRYIVDMTELDSFESDTSSQKYVKRTLDRIVTNLKLEDSYDISEPSEEECDKYKSVYFFEKVGVVLPEHGAHCLVHLPAVRKGHALKASYVLDVVGGPPQTLDITVVNLEKIIELVPFSAYLGVKPWYEFFEAKVKARNITQYGVHVVISNCPRPKIENRHHFHLIDGYVCIQGVRSFHLNAFGTKNIRTEGIMGFNDEFIRDFKLTINDRNTVCFRLRGQGIMPILLSPNRKMPRPEQSPEEIIDEYRFLQKIYYFHMFKDITFVDEEMEVVKEEETHSHSDLSEDYDFSDFEDYEMEYEEEGGIPPWFTDMMQRKWMKLLSTYVYVINNESLPNATILEQILSTVRFKHYLEVDPGAKDLLNRIFRHYMKMECTYDEKMPISLKYFTVTPLPYEQLGYILDMPNLKLNQFRNYDIDLQFFGPGKLIASARTAVKIPGLYVHFEVKKNTSNCHEFVLYRAEEKMPDFYTKRYRNMWEREIDLEVDPKLHHAHSYDCQLRCKLHQRDITAKDRREVKNYYNSFSKSTNFDKKHHFVNCSIFSKCRENFSDTIIRVHILIRPDAKFYTEYQIIEDYLYIDLHMGPTLPILLRGIIK